MQHLTLIVGQVSGSEQLEAKCAPVRRQISHQLSIMQAESSPVNPVKPLPNVKHFTVKVSGPNHPILEVAGILKRLHSPLIESENYRNGRINRYVKYQINRLNSCRDNPRLFWSISKQLMRSTSYLVTCFNNVNSGWHRNKAYGEVINLIKRVKTLNTNKYEYKIVETPKGDTGETRPLGVPSIPWRVYLHGWNNLLLIYMSLYVPETQHGFYPGRGTLSTWTRIYEKVLGSRNIYEFDLAEEKIL